MNIFTNFHLILLKEKKKCYNNDARVEFSRME